MELISLVEDWMAATGAVRGRTLAESSKKALTERINSLDASTRNLFDSIITARTMQLTDDDYEGMVELCGCAVDATRL